jgi:uncharacterized protein YkwD
MNIITKIGTTLGVRSVRTGQCSDVLQRIAEEHATWQADHHVVSHTGSHARWQDIQRQLPQSTSFSEVVANSLPGQSETEAAQLVFKSWRKSPLHWQAVNGRCANYGYAMARSNDGHWYACGIFTE